MKNKSEKMGELIGKVIAIVLLIAVGYLWSRPVAYFFKFGKVKRHNARIIASLNSNMGDFWLTEKEKQDYTFQSALLCDATRKIAKFENDALKTRTDGSYDERSVNGKEANYYKTQKQEATEQLETLSSSPLNQWDAFNNSLKEECALRIAGMLALIWIPATMIVASSYNVLPLWPFLISLAVLGLLQIIVYRGGPFFIKRPAEQITPCPVRITLKNINDHSRGEPSIHAGQVIHPRKKLKVRAIYICGCICLIIISLIAVNDGNDSEQQKNHFQQKKENLQKSLNEQLVKLEKENTAIRSSQKILLVDENRFLQKPSKTNIKHL